MGYSVLSKYRSELMGAAMLWVMLFHAADLTFPIPGLDLFRAAGFGGVDIFILLSAMGLSLSLSRPGAGIRCLSGAPGPAHPPPPILW